jgi:hypothetical protein
MERRRKTMQKNISKRGIGDFEITSKVYVEE